MANSLITIIKQDLITALQAAFVEASLKIDVTEAKQAKFGDYQCNSSMGLAKQLGKSPRDIATAWVAKLEEMQTGHFSKLEVAGPGFINIWLADELLVQKAVSSLADPKGGVEPKEHPQKVIVDFSSPNVAKEMHVGHLRSTVIGNAIARTLAFMGDEVLPLNHIGDWGTALYVDYIFARATT